MEGSGFRVLGNSRPDPWSGFHETHLRRSRPRAAGLAPMLARIHERLRRGRVYGLGFRCSGRAGSEVEGEGKDSHRRHNEHVSLHP